MTSLPIRSSHAMAVACVLVLAGSSPAFSSRSLHAQGRTATPLPAVLPSGAPAPLPPERYRNLARELLAELVAINTTHGSGDNTRAAEAMRARLLAAGFPEEDVLVAAPAPRKGNLVARLRGRDRSLKPIVLLSHIDVVEADAADWTLPPFELVERDGVFYGRGTADDKDESAIHLATIIRMKEEGYVPNRDIVVALTADEEGGSHNGVRFLLEQHREWIDAAFVINEGGGGVLDDDGNRVANTVQAAEKRVHNFRFEVLNPGGHSSRPRADNAIYELAQGLVRISAYSFPVRLTEVTREYLRRDAERAERAEPTMAAAMRAILRNPNDTAAAAVLSRDVRLNSMLRTTCVATMLEGGHASNALPQRARATVNCRVHPEDDPQYVRRTLAEVASVPTLDVSGGTAGGGNPTSPLTPEILRAIELATEEMWPGVPVIPTMSTGATDGRYFRMAGIPTYGVSGLFYGETGAHGMNERVPVQSFYEGQEFIYRLVRLLTTPGVT
ncbi:MAG TPA: M20/M25/M40 family metallo-hydrolase [Gemmatimonadaceae bacterium]|nr:M20/M25/M40 family metallo-hydrolase [Gemmatimonadaceae bacterium]